MKECAQPKIYSFGGWLCIRSFVRLFVAAHRQSHTITTCFFFYSVGGANIEERNVQIGDPSNEKI